MPDIRFRSFLAKHKTIRSTVEALRDRGIIASYWSVRRWRNKDFYPCDAMRQLLAQSGIKS